MWEIIVLTLLGIVALAYLYMTHIYGYWSRKGLPQPSPKFVFGNIREACLMKKHLGIVYYEIYRSYPDSDAVGVYGLLTPKLLLRDPELIKKVVVTEFSNFHDNDFYVNEKADPYMSKDPFVVRGDEWKTLRSKLVSSVTPARMKEIYPLIKNIVPRLLSYLNNNLNKDIETKDLATLFTMDVVSDVVFGISSNCFSDPEAPFRKCADVVMRDQLQVWWKVALMIYLPKVRDFLGMNVITPDVNHYLENAVQEVLAHRKSTNVSRNDLFQYFMKKESGDFTSIMHYVVTFFLEGFESASMVASIAIYELALNPEVQQKLYEEVESMYSKEKDPEYETIMNLPYLDCVLQEAPRKYPVNLFYTRICTNPTQLDINGKSVAIETGTPMIIPVFSIHNDPSYYPNPEVFDPDRFNEENKSARPAYTYMPFGEGPRICPGQKFGLVQAKLLVASIVYKFKILKTEKTPEKITFLPPAFLAIPNEQLLVKFESRK